MEPITHDPNLCSPTTKPLISLILMPLNLFHTMHSQCVCIYRQCIHSLYTHTAPAGFDRIVPLEISSRYILLSWDEPAATNGILVNYTVLVGGVALTTTPPSVLVYNVTSLSPFTGYSFTVQACTSVGCVESPVLSLVTDQDSELLLSVYLNTPTKFLFLSF